MALFKKLNLFLSHETDLFDFKNGDNQEPDAFTEEPKHRTDFQSNPVR